MRAKTLNSPYTLPTMLSFGVHLLVAVGLFVTVTSSTRVAQATKHEPVEIVKAVALDETQINQEVARITAQRRQEAKRQAEKVREAKVAAQKLKQLQAEQVKAQQAINAAKKLAAQKAAVAAQKQHELAQLQQQSKQMQSKIKQQQEQAEKIKQQQKEQAEKLKQQKLAAQKELEKKKQLAELQKKRLAEQQKAIEEQLKQENAALAEQHAKVMQSEIEKYKGLIVAAISHNWLVPKGADKKLACQLLIRIGPGGTVLEVKTLSTSGDKVLDRSAKTAVYKASPLPVPKEGELFDKFRELRLTVRPEQVIS